MYYALSTMLAFHAGDSEAAIHFGRQAIVIDPEFWIGHFQLAENELEGYISAVRAAIDPIEAVRAGR